MGLLLLWKSGFTVALILMSSVIKDVFLEQVIFFQRYLRRYINLAWFRFTRNELTCTANCYLIVDYKMQ